MFPIPWNKAYRKKDGSLVNIDDAMGGDYTLPTASASTKGGIKVGSGLRIDDEVLSVVAELPNYGIADAGKVLGVNDSGELAWVTPVTSPRQYGDYISNVPEFNIETNGEEVTT